MAATASATGLRLMLRSAPDIESAEIISAVRAVAAGQGVLSPAVTGPPLVILPRNVGGRG